MKKYLWLPVFPGIVLSTVIIYSKSLSYYFFQDDWFVLDTIKNINNSNIFTLFSARQDVIYYRPIGMQFFFFLSKSLFGLNAFNFHLISLLFHILNIFLIGLISFQIFRSKLASATTSFFYAIAPFHYMTLSWLSLTWNNIGTFFIFASIYFSLRYFRKLNIKHLFLSQLMFVIAIFTSEFAVITPFVILLLGNIENKNVCARYSKKLLLILTPFFAAIVVYFVFRLIHSSIQSNKDYQITFDVNVIKNLIWYFLWLLAIPQELKFNIDLSSLKIARSFLDGAGVEILPLFAIWLVFILLLFISFKKNKQLKKINIIVILVFLIGLMPVIFLPNHTFPYYLNISSLGVFLYIGYLIKNNFSAENKNFFILNLLIITSWLFLSFLNYRINTKTNWIPGQANTSKIIAENVLIQSNHNHDYSPVVVISEDSVGTEQSLMSQRALRIVLNNPNIKTFVRTRKQAINDYNRNSLPRNAYYVFYYQ